MPHKSAGLCLLACCVVPLLVAGPALATTFTPLSDRQLALQSPVIAEVSIVGRNPAAPPSAAERPATEYTVQVEQLLKGFVPGGALVVRVPGSLPGATSPGEPALRVWGAPSFREGERALLFLAPRPDGTYRVVQLALGAFHEVVSGGRRLALRDLSGMRESAPGGQSITAVRDTARDFERFGTWLASGARGDGDGGSVALPARELDRLARELQARAPFAPAPASEIAWELARSGQPSAKSVEGTRWALALRTGDADAARLLDGIEAPTAEGLELSACRAGGLVSISGTWFDGALDGAKVLGGEVIALAAAGCFLPAHAPAAEVRSFVAGELAWAFQSEAAGQAPPPLQPVDSPTPGAPPTPKSPKQPPAPAADLTSTSGAASAQALATRGYGARACGFDMNRNGIAGEAADCNVCDGVTKDPDGDGVAEDLIYVSCNTGTDNATCGAPGNPCRTINYAWNSRADGPGDGAEDIICFKGTCSETVTVGSGGVAGAYSRSTTGTVAPSFQFPRNPAMLVGWDADNDGSYPPFDPDDTAVLDGNVNGNLALAIQNTGARSDVEYAHFTARDYGLGCPTESGFMKVAAGGGAVSRLYVHDLKLAEINTACTSSSNRIVFNLFVGGTPVSHLAIVNVDVAGYGSYLVRGSGDGTGPYRFQNLSARAKGPAGNQAFGIKLWDQLTGVDVLDSILDLDPDSWGPCSDSVSTPGCEPSYAITAVPCSQGWTIANNELVDWKFGIALQPFAGSGFCTSRPIDQVTIDRNVIRNAYAPWRYGDMGIWIQAGTTPSATAGTVRISNNFLSSAPGWEACIWSEAGNDGGPNPGSISILGNTCVAPINRHAAIAIGNVEGAESAFPQQNYVIKDNVIAGLSAGQRNLDVEYRPSSWDADFNVFDPDGGFVWNGGPATALGPWRTASGKDASSKTCDPAFANPASGDYHLASTDVCARNAGSPLTGMLTIDFDGDNRGQEKAWDIGADEVRSTLRSPRRSPR